MRDRGRVFLSTTCWILLFFLGCSNLTTNKPTHSQPAAVSPQKPIVKMVFAPPVIMVNGVRAAKPGDRVEVSYPQESTNSIAITIKDTKGNEYTLSGEIKVYQQAKSKVHSAVERVVVVDPENAEYEYEKIIQRGYGVLKVRELTQESEDEIGKVVAELDLGTKKKN